ncbi:Flagellar hook-basal body complex protein FliE [Alteripontixanthobacter maritimus]|uniref:Flagellar hook-basal body complex protein FliE n=1 Tax=Alteripontixanthobacter maritimus TaxID=2161824 RepID=A0A369Q3W1_9SPHN|nr:flagellar hook-basal body complex protein FliE [Alteripontixanthobacter maritimus]RDC59140.1 Flagellar hook-basal body complex protein FliE [Alteripontixanthobacter maritimus]
MSAIGGAGAAGLQQVIAMRQQIVDQSDALRGLRDAGSTGAAGSPAPVDTAKPAGGGFADTLDNALDTVKQTQLKSSEMTAAYERGEVTDIAQVMLARQESGVAFEATLQVRNKLLNAYQDIMRMGV